MTIATATTIPARPTLQELADELTAIAATLRDAPPVEVVPDALVSLSVGGFFPDTAEGPRVAAVDQLAAAFGLTADESTTVGDPTHAAVRVRRSGVVLRIWTRAGQQRCGCGAACTHDTAGVPA